jgi:uncharacterized membrane protein
MNATGLRAALLAVPLARPAAAASFTPLGFLFPPDLVGSSTAVAVSADGAVVVGESTNFSLGTRPFRWTAAGGLVPLPAPAEGEFARVADVSADGSAIVGSARGPETSFQAVRWVAGVTQGLGFLPGAAVSQAAGVSGDGLVVVGTSGDGLDSSEAFRLTPEGMTGLGFLPGDERSFAEAASADGSVVVGSSVRTDFSFGIPIALPHAFLWEGGLTALESTTSLSGALDVTPDGSAIVGWVQGERFLGCCEAALWRTGEETRRLGYVEGANASQARGVSADGSIVVGEQMLSCCVLFGSRAFVWDEEQGTRELQTVLEDAGVDLNGWILLVANDVSADGRTVVGQALDPLGRPQAFVAVVPEPAGPLAAGAALLAAAALARRHSGVT